MKENITIKILPRSLSRHLLTLALFGLVYYGAVQLGLLFMLQPERTAVIWPASGVALAALLLTRRRDWRPILAMIFLVNLGLDLHTGYSPAVSAGFALANTLEPALGGFLVLRLLPKTLKLPLAGQFTGEDAPVRVTFTRLSGVARLAIIALLASLVASFLGAQVARLGFGAPYWSTWAHWLIEDALGILLVTPIILAWARELPKPPLRAKTLWRWLEGLLLFCGAGTVAWFGFTASHMLLFDPRPYMIFPFLGWAALRFGPRQLSTTLGLVAVIILGITTQGIGTFPLGGTTPGDRLVMAQIYLSIASLTALLLNAVFIERKKAEAELKDSEASLRFGEAVLRSSETTLRMSEAQLRVSEKQLRESEERWHFALEGAGEGVWDWDIQSGKVFYSRQWKALLGYAEDEIGDSLEEWASRLHPEDKIAAQASVHQHLSGQLPVYRSEHRLRCKEGHYLWILARGKIVQCTADGSPARMITTNSDITSRKEMELSLRYHAHLLENVSEAIISTNANFIIQSWNRAAEEMYGWKAEEAIGQEEQAVLKTQYQEPRDQVIRAMLQDNYWRGEVTQQRQDGVQIQALCSASVVRDETGAPVTLVSANRDITERKRAEEQLRWTSDVNAALAALYPPLTTPGSTIEEIAAEVLAQACNLTQSPHGYVSEIDSASGANIVQITTRTMDQSDPPCEQHKLVLPIGENGRYSALWGVSLNTRQPFYTNTPSSHPDSSDMPKGHIPLARFLSVPVLLGDELAGQISLSNAPQDYTDRDLKAIQRLAEFYALAIQRKHNENHLRKANETLALAQRIARLGSWQNYLPTGELTWSEEMYLIMGFSPEKPVNLLDVASGFPPEELERFQRVVQAAIDDQAPYSMDYRYTRPDGQAIFIHDEGQVLRDEQGQPVWMLGTTLDITARKGAEAEIQKQLAWLEGLHEIDLAMSGSLDMKLTFDILLSQVTEQLGVDAAGLLLFDPAAQTLHYANARGFRTRLAEKVSLPIGKSYAGQAVLQRSRVLHNPIQAEPGQQEKSLFAAEGFKLYIGLPLLARGQVKGVLEVFHRSPLTLEPDWLGYLDILAGQAAIAIDNLQMVEHLQRANQELELAYDSTLESWSRVLDLRDKETEGHSRRVMEQSIRLARAIGIGQSDLVHIYRGALLHDIGKMGVPDSILWKKGSLDDDEWKIMREHPRLAFEMLSTIPYLRQAIDIPYCHHEKWDGSGYPRGLSGVQIPLSARIFTVVDVWDALLSDRPYRSAWTREKAIDYIRDQAGKHFDPQVADMFLKLEQD
jgi:PAS domain S-box-containing protein